MRSEPFCLNCRTNPTVEIPSLPVSPGRAIVPACNNLATYPAITAFALALNTWLQHRCRFGHTFREVTDGRVCCAKCFKMWREE